MLRVKTKKQREWCVLDEVQQGESEKDEVDGMKQVADSIGDVIR